VVDDGIFRRIKEGVPRGGDDGSNRVETGVSSKYPKERRSMMVETIASIACSAGMQGCYLHVG
jgi:hypothetical protein